MFHEPKVIDTPQQKTSFINEKWHIQPATLEIRCLFGAPFEPYPATQPRDDSMLFFYVRGWPVHNVHNGFTRVRFLALNHWFNENKAVCVFFYRALIQRVNLIKVPDLPRKLLDLIVIGSS